MLPLQDRARALSHILIPFYAGERFGARVKITKEPFYYGGQAVIEGVMMRGRDSVAIAVRRPDGQIEVTAQPLASLYKGRLRNMPFVRGIIVLVETLVLGIKALLYSAQVAAAEEESISPTLLWGSVVIAVVIAIALFFIAPLLLTRYLIDPYIASALLSNLIEGTLRIAIFIAYLKLISLMPDVKKVFAYHGAEHKVVNAYEAGVPLELSYIKAYSTAHARCGTSFLLAVLIIAIFVFALLGRPPLLLSVISRIVLIPVIAAVSYEFVRFGATHNRNLVVRSLLMPGLLLQSMTTGEPNDSQLETAMLALKKVIETDSNANWQSSPEVSGSVPKTGA